MCPTSYGLGRRVVGRREVSGTAEYRTSLQMGAGICEYISEFATCRGELWVFVAISQIGEHLCAPTLQIYILTTMIGSHVQRAVRRHCSSILLIIV